jgi:hypothetical protein
MKSAEACLDEGAPITCSLSAEKAAERHGVRSTAFCGREAAVGRWLGSGWVVVGRLRCVAGLRPHLELPHGPQQPAIAVQQRAAAASLQGRERGPRLCAAAPALVLPCHQARSCPAAPRPTVALPVHLASERLHPMCA